MDAAEGGQVLHASRSGTRKVGQKGGALARGLGEEDGEERAPCKAGDGGSPELDQEVQSSLIGIPCGDLRINILGYPRGGLIQRGPRLLGLEGKSSVSWGARGALEGGELRRLWRHGRL